MTSSFDIIDLQRQLSGDIELVLRWMADDKLTLNTLKTDFVVIASAAKMKGVQETFHVTVQDQWIYRAPFVKSLRFYVYEN